MDQLLRCSLARARSGVTVAIQQEEITVRLPSCAVCLLLLFVWMPRAQAGEGELQLIPRLGVGLLEFESTTPQLEQFGTGPVSTFQFGMSLGYKLPLGLILEGGIDTQGEIDVLGLLDRTELFEVYASIGYQLDLGAWRLVPKIGRTAWSLDIDPGPLGDDWEQRYGISGGATFFEMGLSRRVEDAVTVGLNYRDGHYDFGRVRSISLMLSVGFR